MRFLLILILAIVSLAGPAAAQGVRRDTLKEGGVTVISPTSDVDSVLVSNEQALGVDVRGVRRIVVFGKKEGSGEVILLDARKRTIERRFYDVVADVSAIETLIARAAPGSKIIVAKAAGVVVLRGQASNAADVAVASDIVAGAFSGAKIINLIQSTTNDQLAVSVKVMEVRKSKLKQVGLRWQAQNRYNEGVGSIGNLFASAIGGSTTSNLFAAARFTIDRLTLDAFIDFLRSEGAATMLAEPTIVATSGQKARFLAGGELPIPTPVFIGQATNQAVSYTYRPYGVTLEFSALILDDRRVRLQLAPEVSAIDNSQIVEFNGAKVPALTTRKAETTVVLNFGESVAIAGMRANESDASKRGLPFGTPFGLGDALAGSRSSRSSDTELVLIVTPSRAEDAAERMPQAAEAAQGLSPPRP